MRALLAIMGIGWFVGAMPAAAQDDAIEEDTSVATEAGGAKKPVHLTVGAKLGVGGNYLGSPTNTLPMAAPFDDGVGGFGIGGGIFGEARFADGHLGVETGFIFDSSTNWSKYTLNGVDHNPGWSALDMRMPLLINGGTGDVGPRLAVGTGPEFAFPLSASADSDFANVPISARTETHVNWLINLGIAAPLGSLKLSFDVRFAYNLAVPSSYSERLTTAGVLAQHQMDLRLMFGAGYDVLK